MKWLITGGSGQLGRAMAVELKKHNSDFISLNHSDLDITNSRQINECLNRELPDIVLNTAAWTDVDLAESHERLAWAVNAEGPKILAEACASVDAKLIHISTDYVFSGVADSPWGENTLLSPVSAYGRTKAGGERLILDTYAHGTYLVRTAWLYSPWGTNFVKTMIKIALQDSKVINVVNDQIGQPTSASDLASQIYTMIDKNLTPGIYHGTNSGQASWFEVAQIVFSLLGQNVMRVEPISSEEFTRPAIRPAYSVLGHDNWNLKGVNPMKNWQTALEEAFPALLKDTEVGE
jgi:dTDP-4-dehydrorhamnose reductase